MNHPFGYPLVGTVYHARCIIRVLIPCVYHSVYQSWIQCTIWCILYGRTPVRYVLDGTGYGLTVPFMGRSTVGVPCVSRPMVCESTACFPVGSEQGGGYHKRHTGWYRMCDRVYLWGTNSRVPYGVGTRRGC